MYRSSILVTLALGAAVAFADPPAGPPPGMRGPPIERLTQDLGLNESQQAEVKRIFDAQRSKMDTERQQLEASGTHPSRDEMRARHEQADAEIHQQLAAVLNAEQLAKFDQMRKHQRPPGPPPGERQDNPPSQ